MNAFAFSFVAMLALTGCAYALPSPPTTPGHHHSPASVGAGNTVVGGGVGGGGSVFGPGLVYAEATVRHGVSPSFDVGGRVTGAAILGDQLKSPPHRGLYTARAYLHYEAVRRILALDIGVGGGGSAAGGFLAGDFGFTLGYENPHLVPFASGRAYVSGPVTRNRIDLTNKDGDARSGMPEPSFGPILSAGLRIPLGPRAEPFGSILVGMDVVFVTQLDRHGFDMPYKIASGFVTYEHRLRRCAATSPGCARSTAPR